MLPGVLVEWAELSGGQVGEVVDHILELSGQLVPQTTSICWWYGRTVGSRDGCNGTGERGRADIALEAREKVCGCG